MFIKKTKLQGGYSLNELPINNAFGLTERGKIHLRMHTGKLSYGILEPLAISIGNIIVELLLRLLEEFNFLGQFPFYLPQLNLALGDPLLQLGLACIPSTFSSRSITLLQRGKIFAFSWTASWLL